VTWGRELLQRLQKVRANCKTRNQLRQKVVDNLSAGAKVSQGCKQREELRALPCDQRACPRLLSRMCTVSCHAGLRLVGDASAQSALQTTTA